MYMKILLYTREQDESLLIIIIYSYIWEFFRFMCSASIWPISISPFECQAKNQFNNLKISSYWQRQSVNGRLFSGHFLLQYSNIIITQNALFPRNVKMFVYVKWPLAASIATLYDDSMYLSKRLVSWLSVTVTECTRCWHLQHAKKILQKHSMLQAPVWTFFYYIKRISFQRMDSSRSSVRNCRDSYCDPLLFIYT